jgi:hypothetical protein
MIAAAKPINTRSIPRISSGFLSVKTPKKEITKPTKKTKRNVSVIWYLREFKGSIKIVAYNEYYVK